MKVLLASLFAALFALATVSISAAPLSPSGIVLAAGEDDQDKSDSKASTEQKDEEADKDKDKDSGKKD